MDKDTMTQNDESFFSFAEALTAIVSRTANAENADPLYIYYDWAAGDFRVTADYPPSVFDDDMLRFIEIRRGKIIAAYSPNNAMKASLDLIKLCGGKVGKRYG